MCDGHPLPPLHRFAFPFVQLTPGYALLSYGQHPASKQLPSFHDTIMPRFWTSSGLTSLYIFKCIGDWQVLGPGAIQWLQRARITVWPSDLTEQHCPFLYPGVPLCCCLAEWSPLNSSACLFLHPTICCWTSLALELASKNRVHPFLYPADCLKIVQPVKIFTIQWIRKQYKQVPDN